MITTLNQMLPRLFRSEGEIRKYQINTLKIFNDNVTEVSEDEEYDILFNSGGNQLILKVLLGRDFPKEKPILKIIPAVVHHWISTDGVISTAPGLLNFTPQSSDLGRVVQAIIREYQRTPPPLVPSSNVTSPTIPINSEIRASPINYQLFSNKSFSPPSHMPQSSYHQQSIIFPEITELSLHELKFLNENSERQEEFVEQLPLIKEQNKALDDMIAQIEELAESTLSKQEELEQLKKEVDSRIEEVTKLAFENERLHVKYQSYSSNFAPRNIQEQIRLAASKADIESDKIVETFLGGEIDVDKFLADFIKTKMLSQTRKTKEEKLGQQLDKLERAGF